MKLIGITMRRSFENKWSEPRDTISKDWIDFISHNFPETCLIPIPNNKIFALNLVSKLDLDGLILSNGNDWGTCIERDDNEINLIKWFRKKNKPILGICRGFQVINKYFGGNIKNLSEISSFSHAGSDHNIRLIDEKFSMNKKYLEFKVNSFHNEGIGVNDLARNLKPFAISSNIVEGFYIPEEKIIGIQWHPERKNFNKDFDLHLFNILFNQDYDFKI